jgi:hypothetical protein
MANAVVRLCLVNGELTLALKAIRAMKLLGVDMDTEQYKSWVMQVQRRQKSTSVTGGVGGFGGESRTDAADRVRSSAIEGLERLKWFLGLPNDYYRSEWTSK